MDGSRGLAFTDYTLVTEIETCDKSLITIAKGEKRTWNVQFSHVVTDAETCFTLDLKAHKISREAVSGLVAEWGRGGL